MNSSFFFVLFVLGFFACKSYGHNCIHDEIMQGSVPPVIQGVLHAPNREMDKKNTRALNGDPIRIIVDQTALTSDPGRLCTAVGQWRKLGNPGGDEITHSPACTQATCTNCNCWFQCLDVDVLTPSKQTLLQTKTIPDVINYFQNALNLNRVVGNLIFPSGSNCACSGTPGVSIPDAPYNTPGVAADMVIFLTARTTRFTGNTIAFACPCIDDAATKRPLAGFFNIGPNAIDETPISYPEQLGVGIHEVTHALGFTSGKYQFYGAPAGGATPTKTVTYSVDGFQHDVIVMASPKVLEVGKNYFGCLGLQGVELENGGSSGTAASHWERRILYNEYMTGYSSYDPVKSIFTLALFEDMGWYFPNYTAAEELLWGNGQGCPFVEKRCTSRTGAYNCDLQRLAADEGCTFDGKKKGRCNIRTFTSDLDPYYRYYGTPTLGGNDDLADYCGFLNYRDTWRGDCTIPDYNTPGPDYYAIQNFGEHYCPSCRCVTAKEGTVPGPSCHNITCFNGKPKLKIGYVWYDCPSDGFEIALTEGFDGTYVCPPATVCSQAPAETIWPSFVSVTPTAGKVGDTITVRGLNFGTDGASLVLGLDFGCVDGTVKIVGSEITCEIGTRDGAPRLRKDTLVDVIIVDAQGRTATGFKAFTLSNSALVVPSFLLILCALYFSMSN